MTKFAPRYFIPPLIALLVIGSLPAPADGGARDAGCGPALIGAADPSLRAAFEQFRRNQSRAADKICALHRNATALAVR